MSVKRRSLPSDLLLGLERDPKMQVQSRGDEKDQYRTCCAVCHIKFGTTVLGVIELAVCVTVLISAAQQVVWKSGGSQHCFDNILRDCLIFQFSHFNITLILDYIVVIMMIFILLSVLLLFCGILSDTSSLLLPHIFIQAIFLLFSIGYFGLYAVSYFYGDLYTQSRPFTFNHFMERMWLATLLLFLAAFQTYLFSAVIRCSMYISTIEDVRRRRENAFEQCSQRVRLAKANGLWRTTSWGGGFQEYKGQYDENKPKKAHKEKKFHVQWRQSGIVDDEGTTMKLIDYDSEPKGDMHEPLIKLESVDETPDAAPATVGHRGRSSPKKDRVDIQSHSVDQPSTSKSTCAKSERHSSKEGHRRGSSSSTSPQRRTDAEPDAGTVLKRRTSTGPRAPLKKYKSIDSDEAIKSVDHQPRLSQDSRRSSLGNELRRGSVSSSHRVHQISPQLSVPERRNETPQIPHIKRVSISATHL